MFDHGAWDALLATHVSIPAIGPTRVAYGAFPAADRGVLADYLARLQRQGIAGLGWAEQFAFWINLYNAQTVAVVLDHYPVASIRDIALGGSLRAVVSGGPWQAKLMTVTGVRLSLDDIEHAILRRMYRDPRLHYAINCASLGCPSLRRSAFTGANLEAQLQASAREFINSPHGVRFDADRLVLSGIFDWYRKDFGGTDRAVIEHLASHAEAPLRERLLGADCAAGHQYDWALNDVL
ncbi:DUF547 domain-containing protein [Roseomonas fluvialis]|nr:DUF547 domain-containing protein [Roseomonas fluvialis]